MPSFNPEIPNLPASSVGNEKVDPDLKSDDVENSNVAPGTGFNVLEFNFSIKIVPLSVPEISPPAFTLYVDPIIEFV